MSAIRWAVCGTGNIANDFCTTLISLPKSEHQIVAVASRTAEKATAFADKFGIPKSFGSYEEIIGLDNVDIVYLATVSSVHVENSLMFINAGKNVLCESPMALSLEGCQKVLAAVREKGVFFLEGFWSLFNPVYDVVRESIRAGDVGEVRMIQSNFSCRLVEFDVPRLYQLSMGGGLFMELGSYMVRLANMMFEQDQPESIMSDLWKYDTGPDARGGFILRYSNGRYVIGSLTDDTLMEENFFIVRGTKGTIKVPDYYFCPLSVTLPSGESKEFPLPEVPEGYSYVYPRSQLLRYEIQAVREALLAGLKECPKATHADSEAGITVMEKVLQQNDIKY